MLDTDDPSASGFEQPVGRSLAALVDEIVSELAPLTPPRGSSKTTLNREPEGIATPGPA